MVVESRGRYLAVEAVTIHAVILRWCALAVCAAVLTAATCGAEETPVKTGEIAPTTATPTSTAEQAASPSPAATEPAPSTPTPTRMTTPLATSAPAITSTSIPLPEFEELKKTSIRVPYDDLFRGNEQYIGDMAYFQGKIIQVVESEEEKLEFQFRVDITQDEYGFWDDTVFLFGHSGERFLEDDVIEFIGTISGLLTYESIFGQRITIPGIEVIQIRLFPDLSSTPSASSVTVTPTISPRPERTSTPSPAPTPTPTPIPLGASRSNPYPFGGVLEAGAWQIEALEVIRGEEARQRVQDANQYNDPPAAGNEHVLVLVRASYTGEGETDIKESDFRITGSQGRADRRAQYVVDPEPQLDYTLQTGGDVEGWVTFEVGESESQLMLIFDPIFDDSPLVFLALEPNARVMVDASALPASTSPWPVPR